MKPTSQAATSALIFNLIRDTLGISVSSGRLRVVTGGHVPAALSRGVAVCPRRPTFPVSVEGLLVPNLRIASRL